ncbi:hypothetical protein HPB47_014660, partial [Ixodes persulcatus]
NVPTPSITFSLETCYISDSHKTSRWSLQQLRPSNLAILAGFADAIMEVSSPSIATAASLVSSQQATFLPRHETSGNQTSPSKMSTTSASYLNKSFSLRQDVETLPVLQVVVATLHQADQTTNARVEVTLQASAITTAVSVLTLDAASAPLRGP